MSMEDRSRLFRSVDASGYPVVEAGDMDAPPVAITTATNSANNTNNPTTHLTAKPHAFSGAVLSPKHARELTPSACLQIASALAEQSQRRTVVPYTLWITEAWRVLGWAEPSAALFWEMATMYHTLYLAGRAFAADYEHNNSLMDGGGGVGGMAGSGLGGAGGIPPILSCGSASSVGSGTTTHTPVTFDKKKFSTAASAKELPVWLVGTFLLLHCEEYAFWRNLSGKDERRFYDSNASEGDVDATNFASMLIHTSPSSPSLSPRTQLHAGWSSDHGHCAAYLLRHLRKLLLLVAVPHNQEAVNACMHLAVLPSTPWLPPERMTQEYRVDEIRRQHEEEHGQVGLNVHLSLEDLERLHLTLQPPQGGGIDDPPLRLGDFMWGLIKYQRGGPPPPVATLRLADVERELRRHLELEISSHKKKSPAATASDEATGALAKLSLKKTSTDTPAADELRAKQPDNHFVKELSYTHLRGTTIVLKPNPTETSSGASAASGEHNFVGNLMNSQRLHDLTISECSDAHFYLLQPFEHATISACTGCTIVVGAVAGLLHVVDCEKTTITSASRRSLVSNSSDVTVHIFTPSPPLLVGDNRTCQFAPYNTYYDGLREDLLVTGLAAAVVSESHSPYHGKGGAEDATQNTTAAAAWPPLQCASNKWKVPIEMSKLELPEGPAHSAAAAAAASVVSPPSSPTAATAAGTSASSPGADDKAMKGGEKGEATLHAPVLVPASEFHMLFVPVESEAARQRRLEEAEESKESESQYCRMLSEVLNYSPFSLPMEYERSVLCKADRIRTIQQTVRNDLTQEQQQQFEDELNRGFREWLVTSGNLRQVLDLVHLEERRG